MARKKRTFHLILGIFVGIFIGHFIRQQLQLPINCTMAANNQKLWEPTIEIDPFNINETTLLPDKTLIFVGVMTAAKYLETRAKAVYNTWGKQIPGKILFFSSEQSHSNSIPLVSLKTVDDSYPPQKKSFLMLKYMHDNYLDQYEWFLRADDDVYIRAERLEAFLRSINSTKAQFIGQAGRGNNEEFGLLSLEYDENFCMGGPGIIMSRETLRRIAPHIQYCLNNLYTNHEDVEVGRCVQKFAGIPCTWSYEMQSILYHNQSGSLAFTGTLKTREVHRAITLHPIKKSSYMYRLHNYFKELKIQSLKQIQIQTHREIVRAQSHLNHNNNNSNGINSHQMEFIAEEVPLHNALKGSPQYLGDTNLLGVEPGLTRHRPKNLEDVLVWNFLSRSVYSATESNPRKKIDASLAEGINDVIMEVMETINMYSKQRGRIIDFKEILYAYSRLDPLHGVDWVLDLLLVYKKYRGRKMTVPVRRHAYVQQTFTGLEIREIPLPTKTKETFKDKYQRKNMNSLSTSYATKHIGHKLHKTLHDSIQQIKELNLFPFFVTAGGSVQTSYESTNIFQNEIIHIILPLSGRYETFQRFLRFYEEVCILNKEKTKLYIILYENNESTFDYQRTMDLISKLQNKYSNYNDIMVVEMLDRPFSRGEALQIGLGQCDTNDLLLFIDVDIIFTSKSLMKVRLNTIKNKQVYFPIVFSEYHPSYVQVTFPNDICKRTSINNFTSTTSTAINKKSAINFNKINNFDVNDNVGYWRLFGYGILSAYKCDLETIGGFNTTIQGWGLEDVTLFDKFIKSNLNIIRVADPTLRHVYHPIECSVQLSDTQRQMCLGSQANTLGSWRTLYNIVMMNDKIFENKKLHRPGS